MVPLLLALAIHTYQTYVSFLFGASVDSLFRHRRVPRSCYYVGLLQVYEVVYDAWDLHQAFQTIWNNALAFWRASVRRPLAWKRVLHQSPWAATSLGRRIILSSVDPGFGHGACALWVYEI